MQRITKADTERIKAEKEPVANFQCSAGLVALMGEWKERIEIRHGVANKCLAVDDQIKVLYEIINMQHMIIEVQETITKESN